jgi:hypothetical protein
LAVDYVWERFLKTCFFVDALEKAKEAESLNKLLQHKTLHEEVNSESLRKRISDFQKKFPNKL